jgi:hypothetical protein
MLSRDTVVEPRSAPAADLRPGAATNDSGMPRRGITSFNRPFGTKGAIFCGTEPRSCPAAAANQYMRPALLIPIAQHRADLYLAR